MMARYSTTVARVGPGSRRRTHRPIVKTTASPEARMPARLLSLHSHRSPAIWARALAGSAYVAPVPGTPKLRIRRTRRQNALTYPAVPPCRCNRSISHLPMTQGAKGPGDQANMENLRLRVPVVPRHPGPLISVFAQHPSPACETKIVQKLPAVECPVW